MTEKNSTFPKKLIRTYNSKKLTLLLDDNDTNTENDLTNFWKIQENQKHKKTQLERYIEHNAPPNILKFIGLGGGQRLGALGEKYSEYKFSILQARDKGKNTWYDHKIVLDNCVVYVEQKTSGHWNDHEYVFQHVEKNNKWDVLLLMGIGYKKIKHWIMTRNTFNRLMTEGKITNQGNKNGQSTEGTWFTYSHVKTDLIRIKNNADLLRVVKCLQVVVE